MASPFQQNVDLMVKEQLEKMEKMEREKKIAEKKANEAIKKQSTQVQIEEMLKNFQKK